MSHKIAIVGMACRYPDANSPHELWQNVLAQRRAFRRLPDERLNQADYVSTDRSAPDKTYVTQAAVLKDYEFDRVRFRIAGDSYRSADLTHWLALDIAAQALADAGFPDGDGLPRRATGVIVGNTLTGEFSRAGLMRLRWPYVRRVVADALAAEGWDGTRRQAFLSRLEAEYKQPFPAIGTESLAGGLANTIAGRICNYFDLNGGGFIVDGACASSLLAVTSACSALAAGDLEVALVGGVDLSIDPFELVGFAKVGALADGAMRVYDPRSAGFLPGEGCGFVVLMPYAAAVAEGRPIYATIAGWGVSSDGSGGITRPEADGQRLALERAYRRAGYDIGRVGYFEGHGTGTRVGDATELAALTAAREATAAAVPAVLGSVKANIGHTKAAAGVAGLLKAALALHHRVRPPTTGNERPHPLLGSDTAQLGVSSVGAAWESDGPRRAAVSAMGFGGINAHLTLEEHAVDSAPAALSTDDTRLLSSAQDAELFVLSGEDAAALQMQIDRLRALAPALSLAELTDLAATLARRVDRAAEWRAAVVASTPAQLAERLGRLAEWLAAGLTTWIDVEAGTFLGRGDRAPRIGFLFSGQAAPANVDGGAWARRFAAAREQVARADLPVDAPGYDTLIAQPAIVNAGLIGRRVLAQVGLAADFAIGHSLGEISAYGWAGALDDAALLRLATVRGAAMARLGDPTGAMLSVKAGGHAVNWLLNGATVEIACYNSPQQTIVSGSADAIRQVAARAAAQNLTTTTLPVSHAFHSPLVAAAVAPLREHLERQPPGPLRRPVISTVTGHPLTPEDDLRALLLRQVTAPVRFMQALEHAVATADLLIEVGPGRILTGLVSDTTPLPAVALDVGSESVAGLLQAAGAAFALGAPVAVEALFDDRFTRAFDLEQRPTFLTNPCELAPALDEPAGAAPAVETVYLDPSPAATAPPADVAVAPAAAPLEVVRALVAEACELPLSLIDGESRLLSDLHLNSITVSQLVVSAAQKLGLPPPAAPTTFADVSVAGLAATLGEQAEMGQSASRPAANALPDGIDSWIRSFVPRWLPEPLTPVTGTDAGGAWQVFGPVGHGDDSAAPAALATALHGVGGQGIAVCVADTVEDADLAQMLAAAQAALGAVPESATSEAAPAPSACTHFVLVQTAPIATSLARTLYLERPELTVCAVTLPPACRDYSLVAAEVRAASGYVEVRYAADGTRTVPRLDVLPLPDEPAVPEWLSADDVLIVTGGAKGITAASALALGQASGVALALVGLSLPENDAELRANLDRMRAAGLRVRYDSCDIADPAAVADLVARVEADFGRVTGIIHGAARNVPRRLAQLDLNHVQQTLQPKLYGLHNLLAAIPAAQLRLLLTFGSIIGRSGLIGEAHYALANEQLAHTVDRFRQAQPHCRCLNIEWSIWSEVGMGARLGSIDMLVKQGITPIPPRTGVAILLDLLARLADATALPTSVVVMGRYGGIPTLRFRSAELPLYRFLEAPQLYYPGIELIADNHISSATDPYLEDHVVQGERLLPGVAGLEAMAQAAMALAGRDRPPSFEEVAFAHPVIISASGGTVVRIVAQVVAPDRIAVAVRSEATGFQVDHFRAVCQFDGADESAAAYTGAVPCALPPLDDRPIDVFYDQATFHGGRFRRIVAYRRVTAYECVAEIDNRRAGDWFSRYLPQSLVLGDLGTQDALIHALQACLPHATLLPVSVERIVTAPTGADTVTLYAREREQDGREYVYDLLVCDATGRVTGYWNGLRLRRTGERSVAQPWWPALAGSYMTRTLRRLDNTAQLAVALEAGAARDRATRGTLALGRLVGRPVTVDHLPDGKPLPVAGRAVSLSHSDGVTLAVSAGAEDAVLGCDLQQIEHRERGVWESLLGARRMALLDRIVAATDDSVDEAATRLWAVGESLFKAALPVNTPVTLVSADNAGWVVFRAGRHTVATVKLRFHGATTPAVAAVLW